MNRPLPPVLILAASIALPCAAFAQDRDNARYDPDRGSPWTFELGGATDNRSKGASKSGGDPYVFGEVQYNAASGFYADAEFETIDSAGSTVETEIEAGWQFSGGGFDFDASVSHKWRVNADPGQDAAAFEFQFDVIREFGDVDARFRVEHSPDGLGSTEAWTWVETRVRFPLADRLQGAVMVGRREQDNAPDYTGWSAGVAYALTEVVELELAWHGTDIGDQGAQYEDTLVAAVLFAF
ncbi:TorF family putative porin [Brevundimonas aurifodinae]|uniref:Porin domain-containing protein n=2 Tax=Brevundimonas TaxID=41275 RepID=A0A258FNZ8_9CAUL|nr:MAG: hypothetical protein B7Z42_12120 [Brevundimonas sp. 12-68-7]OYX33927.1 MAG: hypothetical protein B7Z01_07120 [Brevundimonas subvibrioides]